jgi:hypothetical protein
VDKEESMNAFPRLFAIAATVILALAPSAQGQPPYQGPLWDAHSHPIPWLDPPLTVPAVAARA